MQPLKAFRSRDDRVVRGGVPVAGCLKVCRTGRPPTTGNDPVEHRVRAGVLLTGQVRGQRVTSQVEVLALISQKTATPPAKYCEIQPDLPSPHRTAYTSVRVAKQLLACSARRIRSADHRHPRCGHDVENATAIERFTSEVDLEVVTQWGHQDAREHVRVRSG